MSLPTYLYRVVFRNPNGSKFTLDTTDPEKIGPWLAEMFTLMPYHPSWGPDMPVQITTSQWGAP